MLVRQSGSHQSWLPSVHVNTVPRCRCSSAAAPADAADAAGDAQVLNFEMGLPVAPRWRIMDDVVGAGAGTRGRQCWRAGGLA